MSVQTQIDRIKTNVNNSFAAVAAKGGTVPESLNSDNLYDAIMGIPVTSGGGSNYSISITFDSAFLGRQYMVTGPDEETHTGVVPESLQETVPVYHGGAEYTVISTDSSGGEYSTTVLVGSLFGTYSVTLQVTYIYGVTWNGTSESKWTRTDNAEDFVDPVPYTAGATSYGSPFDNLMPWAGMTIEERTGGTMVKIPKFWYQLYQNTEGVPSSGMTIRISDKPVKGFQVSPAHMDRGDGHGERDVVYVGRYHCGPDFKSKTGVLPITNVTIGDFAPKIHSIGATCYILDFATRFTIWLLYLVEFADWDSQSCIGYGCGIRKSTENMGYTDSMPYHTGTTQTSRTTYGLGTQYRYIEGLWDNAFDTIDGIYNDTNGLNIILNPEKFASYSGGELVGSPIAAGNPVEFTVSSSGGFYTFFPTKDGGSDRFDYWAIYEGYNAIYTGGAYGETSTFGMFYMVAERSWVSSPSVGSRIMELQS